MSHLRVVSITDHETVRERAHLITDLVRYAARITDELRDIDQRLHNLRAAVERLQQGGGSHPSG